MNDASRTESGAAAAVPAQRGSRALARRAILCRYARLSRTGHPIFCSPSRDERAGRVPPRQTPGTNGKVIYSTREDAESAAREMETVGSRPMRPYLCGRSRSGHFHLTTDGVARPHTDGVARPHTHGVPAPRPVPLPIPLPRRSLAS